MDLTTRLNFALLYVENQGDKFHPMSDELLRTLQSDTSEDMKLADALQVCDTFATRFSYHVNRLQETLQDSDED